MADDKLNTSPEENKSLGPAAPQGPGDPPAPAQTQSPGNPPGHEQAVIPSMAEDAAALAGKVIDLSGIKAAADHNGKGPIAPDVAAKPPETAPDQKRRGRPPKEPAGVSAGKKEKAAEPRTGRRRPVRRPRPLFGTKCPEVRKLTRARKRAPAVRLHLNPLRR